MIYYLIITPAGDTAEAARCVIEHIRNDPTVLVIEQRESKGWWLYFCDSAEEAAEERRAHEQGALINPALCHLTVTNCRFLANQTGWGESQERLAALILWILDEFAPCKVTDGETHEDVSALARANPAALLR